MTTSLPLFETLMRMTIAGTLGGLVGLERQWAHRTAALPTNALVALGAAAFMLLSLTWGTPDAPGRVAGQIVSGIGFLGAGVMMREGVTVHGLSTAATIWCSAAVGSFAAVGRFVEAATAALFVIGANLILGPLGDKIATATSHPAVRIEPTKCLLVLKCTAGQETTIRQQVRILADGCGAVPLGFSTQGTGIHRDLRITLRIPENIKPESLVAGPFETDGVQDVTIETV